MGLRLLLNILSTRFLSEDEQLALAGIVLVASLLGREIDPAVLDWATAILQKISPP